MTTTINKGTTTNQQNETSAEAPSSELLVPVEELIAHPYNVRADAGDLDGLVASIRGVGFLQAISLTNLPDCGFGVVFVSRRLAAAKAAAENDTKAAVREL